MRATAFRVPAFLIITASAAYPQAAKEKPAAGRPPGPPVFDRARFYPAPGREKAMVGGRFSGSNVSATDGFETLVEIKDAPAPGRWNELAVANTRVYRWLRYEGPDGSHGAVAEVEFDSGPAKLNGVAYGSIGDRAGRVWRLAVDGKPETWFESGSADGQFVGLDLMDRATARVPALDPKPDDADGPVSVALRCPTPGATIRYTLDGTNPGRSGGALYTGPIAVDKTTTVVAVSVKEGLAPSPPTFGTYLVGSTAAKPGLKTLHVGNSLTATTARFATYARTAGYRHEYRSLLAPGAWTRQLWDVELVKQKDKWSDALAALPRVDHFTVQPRDFDIAEEAGYDVKFFNFVREKSPDVQPWLYAEWTEQARQRPTDKGTVASHQMTTLHPALSWEESMSAMLLYVEELQHALRGVYTQGKRPRVIPSAVAMGLVHAMIERGEFPGAGPGSFYPLLYADQVHPNANGAYLVDLTWYAAFYGESPVGKVLPVGTDLTPDQAAVMQKLAWGVVKNYPDCGLFDEGTAPVAAPGFSPAPALIDKVTPVTLTSATPDASFRYTLDGTTPTRTRGYVYCGVVSVRPGMTLKAVAFRSGMADSPVTVAAYGR